jgi:hypothetical protein
MFGRNSNVLLKRITGSASTLVKHIPATPSSIPRKARVGESFKLTVGSLHRADPDDTKAMLAYQKSLLNIATDLATSHKAKNPFVWLKFLHDEFHRMENLIHTTHSRLGVLQCSSEEVVSYENRGIKPR